MFAKTLLQYCFYSHPSQMLMCISLQLRKVKLDSELVFSLNLAVLNPLFNLERKTGLEYLSVPFIICQDLHHFLCHRLANERKIIFIVNCRRMLFHKLRQVSIYISREKLLEVADLPVAINQKAFHTVFSYRRVLAAREN